jgi:hypothetical protein
MRSVAVLLVLLVAGLCACSSEDAAVPGTSSSATTAQSGSATEIRTVTPVDAAGAPASSYTSREVQTLAAVTCAGDITGVYRCSDLPEDRQFCWDAGDTVAACLADPRDTDLVMVGATFVMMSDVSPYIPAALDLADGSRCTLGHNPMAMATGNAAYVHVYGCKGGPTTGVYTEPLPGLGNPVREVVDRSGSTWTVQAGDDSGPGGTVDVLVAYQLQRATG